MEALLLKSEPNQEGIRKELLLCEVDETSRQLVERFLLQNGVDTLWAVNPDLLLSYRLWLGEEQPSQKSYYVAALERCLRTFSKDALEPLRLQMEEVKLPRAIRHKALAFLVACGIQNLEEITYQTRKAYEAYLQGCGCRKEKEYVKGLDLLKLHVIQKESSSFLRSPITYQPKPLYLGYFPDYAVAMGFYYVQDKEELLFDFSLSAPSLLKKQVFDTLHEILRQGYDRKEQRSRHLLPLKTLYLFCVKRPVTDLLRFEEADLEAYQKRLKDKPPAMRKACLQILDRSCRFLFLQREQTDWEANVWYLDRFSLQGRNHPASLVEKLRFASVLNRKNRKYLQEYMRYCIGLSSRAMHTIRPEHYNLLQFLRFCDGIGKNVEELSPKELEAYLTQLDGTVQEEAFNKKLQTLYHFFCFLISKGYLKQPPLWLEYYKKKFFPQHHNRSVSAEFQRELLLCLKEFPEHLRLMYLHLWCLGLRCSEVCCLKGDAYFLLGEDAWLRVYQYKTGNEKTVPIPKNLYRMMQQYIEKNGIRPEDYIFKSRKGGAYSAETFCIQILRLCRKLNIGEGAYHFRSHDFRHTAATRLYTQGSSIQAVRDYIGHQREDMTRQYLDDLPEKVDAANETYFACESLGAKLKRRKEKADNGRKQEEI